LAVLGNGPSTVVPRRDVVGFHLLYFKVLLQIKQVQAHGIK
jgi:hypothetical protein